MAGEPVSCRMCGYEGDDEEIHFVKAGDLIRVGEEVGAFSGRRRDMLIDHRDHLRGSVMSEDATFGEGA